ncbi:hypothetical protein F2Q70_00025298 [Brassica cretica]|uniref:Vta1/callose synthase N-terminal domain-containing protein n=1 Tax=Brassica cretica TaxID=69181 RepID=A0A8S9L615_BRACR|nr:hypothetical protein F2Q70_00025298 [Brassica cretica]
MAFMESEVVPSSVASILRLANEVEASNPRVAYACRFYAFEKACKIDPSSSRPGVRQFKTALLRLLEHDQDETLRADMQKGSDACEMESFYQHYNKTYIQPLLEAADKADRAQLKKAYQTDAIFLEVLKSLKVEVADEVMEAHTKIIERIQILCALEDDDEIFDECPPQEPIVSEEPKLKRENVDQKSFLMNTIEEGNKQLLEQLKKTNEQRQTNKDNSF